MLGMRICCRGGRDAVQGRDGGVVLYRCSSPAASRRGGCAVDEETRQGSRAAASRAGVSLFNHGGAAAPLLPSHKLHNACLQGAARVQGCRRASAPSEAVSQWAAATLPSSQRFPRVLHAMAHVAAVFPSPQSPAVARRKSCSTPPHLPSAAIPLRVWTPGAHLDASWPSCMSHMAGSWMCSVHCALCSTGAASARVHVCKCFRPRDRRLLSSFRQLRRNPAASSSRVLCLRHNLQYLLALPLKFGRISSRAFTHLSRIPSSFPLSSAT